MKTKCNNCGIEFEKRNADYNRNEIVGARHFCSRSCCISTINKEISPENRKKYYNISKHAGNRQDEFSKFRRFISRINKTDIIKLYGRNNLDVNYLKKLWESQNGKCAYTNISMILPKNTKDYYKHRSLKKASLDRINSTKGYIKGNVQFVCSAINIGKKDFTHEEMLEFISEIKNTSKNHI